MAASEESASELLRRAQALHAEGRIADALTTARRAVAADPALVEGWTYIGKTLVTRFLRFQEGLDALERARDLAPADGSVLYDLGWCYEFVAYRLEKQATRPYRDPMALYQLAAETLTRCLEFETDEGMRADAEDLRDSIYRRRL
jgi:tetratricopeptide (TPR) repeat protein